MQVNAASIKPLNQFLRMAVMAGVESAVQIHIERGDNLNARDNSGMTPLMLSAARNRPAICKLLLSAGADDCLVDPSGRTALDIAIATGSFASATILNAVRPLVKPFSPPEIAPSLTHKSEYEQSLLLSSYADLADPQGSETSNESPSNPEVHELIDVEFNISNWEAEKEPTRPEADLQVVGSARAVQIAITTHEPIDSSVEWDDIESFLPEMALPLARAEDADGRAKLRRLLLRALREGSVPALNIQDQSTNEDRSLNPLAAAYLTMVVNDLGAETDERLEYSNTDESFEVFVNPDETPDEEAALDEALVAIDQTTSRRHEPLRIYQREFQRLRLLTAEEEIQLAKEMEAALDETLNTLITWPNGVALVIAACEQAIAGSRQLSSVWVGSESDSESASADTFEIDTQERIKLEEATDEEIQHADSPPARSEVSFTKALDRLKASVEGDANICGAPREIRQAITGLRLSRRFLLELMDAASGPSPCPGFRNAMSVFLRARDRMTTANLKLAFFQAKKYLYCGEPLDDLAQEANLGLMKAVDRYDWRKGFRFSTYATWWIRQQISRYIADKARTIRVPVHIHEKLQLIDRQAQTLEKRFHREPTIDELAECLEMPRHKLAAILRIAPEPLPMDDVLIDSILAVDVRDSYVAIDPSEIVEKIQLNRAVDSYITSLTNEDRKEERILRMRFGIGTDDALTLDEIGTRFNVTRERIRQIEAKALKKLRHPVRSEPFARTVLGIKPMNNFRAPSASEP